MKAALACIVAFVFLILGWLFLAVLLYGVGYVASQAREGAGLIGLLHILLMWILAPGFGGFLATYVTPRLFKHVAPATILTSFVSVVVTLAILASLPYLIFVQEDNRGIGRLAISLAQVSAIVVGARIGRRWSEAFAAPQARLADLADEALEEHRAGQTEPLDPDRL